LPARETEKIFPCPRCRSPRPLEVSTTRTLANDAS
jgi:hypothetical protein